MGDTTGAARLVGLGACFTICFAEEEDLAGFNLAGFNNY